MNQASRASSSHEIAPHNDATPQDEHSMPQEKPPQKDARFSAETPAEKPKIKASAAKRANATVIGMLMATGVSLGLAIVLPLLSPSQTVTRPSVDVVEAATQAEPVAGFIPLAPLPEGWSVNYARWNSAKADGVASWEVGYTTASGNFIALVQSAQANPSWIASVTDNAVQTGQREFSGVSWTLVDKPGISSSLFADLGNRSASTTATSSVPPNTAVSSTVVLRYEPNANAPKTAGNFSELDTIAQASMSYLDISRSAVPGASNEAGRQK